jgi:hypothetical protein
MPAEFNLGRSLSFSRQPEAIGIESDGVFGAVDCQLPLELLVQDCSHGKITPLHRSKRHLMPERAGAAIFRCWPTRERTLATDGSWPDCVIEAWAMSATKCSTKSPVTVFDRTGLDFGFSGSKTCGCGRLFVVELARMRPNYAYTLGAFATSKDCRLGCEPSAWQWRRCVPD